MKLTLVPCPTSQFFPSGLVGSLSIYPFHPGSPGQRKSGLCPPGYKLGEPKIPRVQHSQNSIDGDSGKIKKVTELLLPVPACAMAPRAAPSCAVNLGELQSEPVVNGPAAQGSFQQVGVWSYGRLAISRRRDCWDKAEPSLGDQLYCYFRAPEAGEGEGIAWCGRCLSLLCPRAWRPKVPMTGAAS